MTNLKTTAWASNGRDVVEIEGFLDPKQLEDSKVEFEKINLSSTQIKRLACELNSVRKGFELPILSEEIERAMAYCNKPSLRGDTEETAAS
tara:strand:- start:380 stop:652 length:273 start_codon:yes stop_codon:yes gene_type:complete